MPRGLRRFHQSPHFVISCYRRQPNSSTPQFTTCSRFAGTNLPLPRSKNRTRIWGIRHTSPAPVTEFTDNGGPNLYAGGCGCSVSMPRGEGAVCESQWIVVGGWWIEPSCSVYRLVTAISAWSSKTGGILADKSFGCDSIRVTSVDGIFCEE